jgi:hypothetical protein
MGGNDPHCEAVVMKICLLCFAALVAFTGSTAAETVFHVAPTGSDSNPGTRRKPLATLERARQAVRMAGPGEVHRCSSSSRDFRQFLSRRWGCNAKSGSRNERLDERHNES